MYESNILNRKDYPVLNAIMHGWLLVTVGKDMCQRQAPLHNLAVEKLKPIA